MNMGRGSQSSTLLRIKRNLPKLGEIESSDTELESASKEKRNPEPARKNPKKKKKHLVQIDWCKVSLIMVVGIRAILPNCCMRKGYRKAIKNL